MQLAQIAGADLASAAESCNPLRASGVAAAAREALTLGLAVADRLSYVIVTSVAGLWWDEPTGVEGGLRGRILWWEGTRRGKHDLRLPTARVCVEDDIRHAAGRLVSASPVAFYDGALFHLQGRSRVRRWSGLPALMAAMAAMALCAESVREVGVAEGPAVRPAGCCTISPQPRRSGSYANRCLRGGSGANSVSLAGSAAQPGGADRHRRSAALSRRDGRAV